MLKANQLGEIDIKIEDKLVRILIGTGTTHLVPNPDTLSMSPPQIQEKIQMVGVTNNPITVPKSLPVPFQIGSLSGARQFLLVPLYQCIY